ncbi:type I restriction system, subunit S [Sulfurimonas gotlandica GD1]|uniref:Type I restriction system, subunit S n=1 Tax=Sulfurimonas gotlandica (strain DSM 19862 / JCM 16533 / GD1) TaxID=929558 RepID=H1FWX5_SULGG|nr:restriction endonuclease subunit S [Sulfurimonas gotlandica]EHP30551.1 type I restriction system, subunit S [Sulfurimonas gotlandica GD1]
MKQGWAVKKLGELCELYQPKTISSKDMCEDGQYPVFGANGIIGKYDKYNHEEPQLLITCRGATCGSVNISEPQSWINGNAMVVRPIDDSLHIKFVEYLFRGGIDISKTITGAAQPQITRQSLSPILISFPQSFPEQQRIVAILDEAFEAIAKAKTNAEQNLKNAKELFESYLQSVFENKGDGWEEKTLEDVCKITSKLIDPKKSEFQNLVHVGAGNIESQKGTLIDLKTAKEENLISGKFLFDESMILYSKIRPYLMKVVNCNFKGLCSADIYPLWPFDNKMQKDFLYHLLLSKNFTEYAILGSQRAGMPKVNREHLFSYRFYLPPLSEQEQIVQKLNALSAETKRLETIYQKNIEDLEELKKSILQKAFNGEL